MIFPSIDTSPSALLSRAEEMNTQSPPQAIPPLPEGIQLIGIHGRAGSGKDTIANYLHHTYRDVWREAFADPLKDAAAAAFGIPIEDFYDPEAKECIDPFWQVSPRMIAQFFGTELFRENIWKLLPRDQQDFWVRRLAGKLSRSLSDPGAEYSEGDTVIITDLRFQNEANYIIENGGIIIHLTRPGNESTVGIPSHASETQSIITPPEVSYSLINDTTIDDLYEGVEKILKTAEIDLIAKPYQTF